MVAVVIVVVAAFIGSMVGAYAIVRRLSVTVAPGELVVLVGGRHRGPDRVWRGWRIVSGGRTLRLPAELVVRVPAPRDRADDIAAAVDAALFRRRPGDDEAALIRAAASDTSR
jgi:hypothetical protein